MILLIKEVFKNVDKTEYFRSINGHVDSLTEPQFAELFKMSFTLDVSSESYFDRTVITRQVEFICR